MLNKTCRAHLTAVLLLPLLLANIAAGAQKPTVTLKNNEEQLSADYSEGNRRKGTVVYSGNVDYRNADLNLKANTLSMKNKSTRGKEIVAQGAPLTILQNDTNYSVDAKADTLHYYPDQQKIVLSKNIQLQLKQNNQYQLNISANHVNYFYQSKSAKNPSNKLQPLKLEAQGNRVTLIAIENKEQRQFTAQAQKILYDYQSQTLTFENQVEFREQEDVIKAHQLIYNLKTQSWQIPPAKNKRFEITNES